MMNYEEEKIEAEFREIIKEDGLWHPIAFIDSFSNDFIREMRKRLWMNGPAVKLAIKDRGQKFYEEIYGRENYEKVGRWKSN